MTEEELAERVNELLEAGCEYEDEFGTAMPKVKKIRTFEDYGVLTTSQGFVISFEDDSKAFITIQKGH